ncbi:unnamed protein product, partial [Mesorhabditis belari]|uniref:C-type lectin domain-containing protein n=1 Tax=Mesorhabditis belari TaxID=2138241 RepID=A0AAF3FL60_9BILA
MYRFLLTISSISTWIGFSLSICPKGGIPGEIEGSCLFVVKLNGTFESAKEFCLDYDGNLVSIKSEKENEKVLGLTKVLPESTKFIWLGGTFNGKKITWIDGSSAEFSALTEGSPSGNLLMNLTSGKWTTSNWNGMFPFACLSQPQQDPSNQPPSCPPYSPCPTGWVYSEKLKQCYKTIFNVIFTEADEGCRMMNSFLASIHSDEENDFVNDLGKAGIIQPTWSQVPLIGGKRTGPEKTDWKWLDGTSFNYTKWADGEPSNNGNNEFCLQTYSDLMAPFDKSAAYLYKWNDEQCEIRYRVAVCKQAAKF